MFDINLFFVNQVNGVERSTFPGLLSMVPPRRTARGREGDFIFILLSITGETSLTADLFQEWLAQKVESYYKTPGTVTLAMKALVESINTELLNRNLKRAKDGNQVSASLNFAVARKESIYFTQVGSTHTFFTNQSESLEILDSENPSRGLGMDQMLTCRFVQKPLSENDVVIFSPLLNPSWSAEYFNGIQNLSAEALSRRIFNQSGINLKTAVLKFTVGNGKCDRTQLRNTPSQLSQGQPSSTPPSNDSPREKEDSIEAKKEVLATAIPIKRISVEAKPEITQKPELLQKEDSSVAKNTEEVQPSISEEKVEQEEKAPTELQAKAGEVTQTTLNFFTRCVDKSIVFLKKVFPGFADESIQLTKSTLIGIAVIVPVLIVIIAGSIYVNRGKVQQFNLYLLQAQEYAIKAEAQIGDEPSRIASLQQALFWLDKAETYGQSSASTSLRNNVQSVLDQIEGVQRLEFVPVVDGGLQIGSNITQITANNTDVYLLESTSGKVLRFYLDGGYYKEDQDFDCGPNPRNALNSIGAVIDMVGINVNNSFKSTLLVIDAFGNIEYCIPGKSGVIGSLTAPDNGWMKIRSISINDNFLYVMDPAGNAVYRYRGQDYKFADKPTLFFDNFIPEMVRALDIEVKDDELYMLRSNGEMVECTYSHLKDYKLTECIDPAPYGDMRTSDTPALITFPEAKFIQLRMTAAPDSSIYLLDASGKTLYHFSLQRNLQKIMHPRLTDGLKIENLTPTAFTVSSSRIVFMAFGNQIYYASLP